MSEKQNSPESSANKRWRSAVQKLEWNTIVQLSQLEETRPTFIQEILSAIGGAQFPNPQEPGKISSGAVAYINSNDALKELANIVSSNEKSRRVEFWHCILYTGTAPAKLEKHSTDSGVPNIVAGSRSNIASVISAGDQLPDALQKKYADLIAQIRKEDSSEVWNVKNITPEQAQVIVYAANTSPAGPLGVGLSIESMTPEVAKELIKTRSHSLYLPALRTLHLESAKILATRDGSLYLDGLEVMTPSLSAAFATHKHALSLRGLKNVNLPLATELAKHAGSLSLNGVQMVTPEIVKMLASGGQSVSLLGLQQVTPDTVSALADASNVDLYHSNIGLNSSSAYLVRRIRQGEFNDVKWEQSFSPQVAAELVHAYPEHSLSLEVKQLSPATAKALAEYTGDLHFEKLKELDVPTAEALAKHHGLLEFKNLRIHDIAVASALAKHTGVLNLWSSDWSDDVLRVFVAMPDIYLQDHSYYVKKLRDQEKKSASIESATQNAWSINDHELTVNDVEELVFEEEPPEPLPENIDDYYVSYSVQIASGHTEGGSIKVGDLMRRVEQRTISASYARDVLIKANEILYGEVDHQKMNEKERKAMQILQMYIDQLQGK